MHSKLTQLTRVRYPLAVAVLLLPINLVLAADITVNVAGDVMNSANGDCSLREAIASANTDSGVDACAAGSGADTITVPGGSYTLTTDSDPNITSDNLVITSDIIINGASAATTIIEGPPGTDGPGLGDDTFTCCVTIFEIQSGTVIINDVTIQNGMESVGGGIDNNGLLTINNSIIRHNFSDQSAGIYINAGAVTLNNTTVRDNFAITAGGGIFIKATTSLTLNDSTISNNTMTNSLGDHFGGGIYSLGTLNINNSTLSANSADFGGAIYLQSGIASLNNATITNNDSPDNWGAGGIFVDPAATASIRNSIVAKNTGANKADCNGDITSLGYNIIKDCTGLDASDQQSGANPLLGALANNNGVTQTHALLTGSPAIEGGDPNGCLDHTDAALTTDQRGEARAQDADEDGSVICDIGAYEASSPIAAVPADDTSGGSGSGSSGGGLMNPLSAMTMALLGLCLRRLRKDANV